MSALMMFSLVAVIGLASLLCNSAAWLWMAAKWCRIPAVSYLRALAAMALVLAIDLSARLAVNGVIHNGGLLKRLRTGSRRRRPGSSPAPGQSGRHSFFPRP